MTDNYDRRLLVVVEGKTEGEKKGRPVLGLDDKDSNTRQLSPPSDVACLPLLSSQATPRPASSLSLQLLLLLLPLLRHGYHGRDAYPT